MPIEGNGTKLDLDVIIAARWADPHVFPATEFTRAEAFWRARRTQRRRACHGPGEGRRPDTRLDRMSVTRRRVVRVAAGLIYLDGGLLFRLVSMSQKSAPAPEP